MTEWLPAIDWIQKKLLRLIEDKNIKQTLMDEVARIYSALQDLKNDLEVADMKPLLKEISLNKINNPIYKSSESLLYRIERQRRNYLSNCNNAIGEFCGLCKDYNILYGKLYEEFIKSGLSIANIKDYDPERMSSYSEIKKLWRSLRQKTTELKQKCADTIKIIEENK